MNYYYFLLKIINISKHKELKLQPPKENLLPNGDSIKTNTVNIEIISPKKENTETLLKNSTFFCFF